MRKVGTWIQTHLVLVEVILVLGVFIVSLLMGLTARYEELMITLLVFLGCELIFLIIGYLDPIMQYIKKDFYYNQTRSSVSRSHELVKSAKESVIIVGSTLSSVYSYKKDLLELSSRGIRIELFYSDPNSIRTNQNLCQIIKKASFDEYFAAHQYFITGVYNELHEKPNITFYTYEGVSPITYIGIDVNRHSGRILAEHYIRGKECDLAFLVKPGCELYSIYRDQLSQIQENSTKIEVK